MSPAFDQADDCYTIADFEIGKLLFTTHMAIQLAQMSPDGRGSDGLCALDALITTYDFEGAVGSLAKADFCLPRTELVCDETYQDILYKIIGRTRLGDTDAIQHFTTLMNQLPSLDGGISLATPATPQPAQNGRNTRPHVSEANDWEYTCLLWEKAQAADATPKVTETRIGITPPKFRVSIRCLGAEASGEGRNKKVARHIAARGVCERLNFRLPS
ncbi:hypothetical protein BDV26DRAFT_295607 [Aspergillus bertholletiae]|uniref:DRBM domain-containing protein n=1 Tax=Aspergillus bertholletiae TaxID=1226010 RepID=A0A5N7B0H9_9EURO|nr:hypothetical protein BDV26DRAFT_295607 [Aspergillus bertholletiae]